MKNMPAQSNRKLIAALRHIWITGTLRVQSDYARHHGAEIAMVASLGLITTRETKERYGRDWRLTAKGIRVLETSSI
jgi:hypothetical protein